MFKSLKASERIEAPENTTRDLLNRYARDWQAAEKVVLYDEVRENLTRAACTWLGVPLPEVEVETRTAQMTALFQDAGAVDWKHWGLRLVRHRTELWTADIIERVCDGSLRPAQESAAHVVATWRDLNGALLTSKVVAVELLTVLCPTVAVSAFIVQTAHTLHRDAEWQEKLRNDERLLEHFVQEVRRLYWFFPAVAARVKSVFEWLGYHFPRVYRVLLDLYGTNSDARSWDGPQEFWPERFRDRSG